MWALLVPRKHVARKQTAETSHEVMSIKDKT